MLYDLDAGIEAVTAEIDELERRREALVRAKAALEELGVHPVDSKPDRPGTDVPSRPTRKQSIVEFLRTAGPMKRSDLVEHTEIPAGTVSYELNDKETFIRLEDGRWDLLVNHQEPRGEETAEAPELTEDDIPF